MKANWFKPFQGMEKKNVKKILEKLLDGKLLLRKGTKSDDMREDLQSYCAWMKMEERLLEEIIRFYDSRYNKGVLRKELKRKHKITRTFLKEIILLLSDGDVAMLKRNVKWKGVPSVLENKLVVVCKEVNALECSDRIVPFSIIETCGDLLSSKIPVDVTGPELVVADLTASPDWDKNTFEGMFKVLFSLFTESRDIKFTLVVYLLPTAILDFLTSYQKFEGADAGIKFKPFWGYYEPEKPNEGAGIPIKGQGFLKVVLFITAKGQDFAKCPHDRRINLFCKKPVEVEPYYLRRPQGQAEEHKKAWLLEHAPTWSMVQKDELPKSGRIHPYCKRPDDIEDMIYNWSNYRGVVLDIFSGGVVLRADLKASRQVITFARSSQEYTFLEAYVKVSDEEGSKGHIPSENVPEEKEESVKVSGEGGSEERISSKSVVEEKEESVEVSDEGGSEGHISAENIVEEKEESVMVSDEDESGHIQSESVAEKNEESVEVSNEGGSQGHIPLDNVAEEKVEFVEHMNEDKEKKVPTVEDNIENPLNTDMIVATNNNNFNEVHDADPAVCEPSN
ncbi:hypothetical protein R1sor_013777 [Riccia sorocarpa]|uniref:Uncharacterized protein n=1 Tax=Riccia sorocarpa TaxID=122646 RepID=A0ABD3H7K0_9MARC